MLTFPFAPMPAALERKLPMGEQWLCEPKLDGFRAMLGRNTNGHIQLLSRNLRDLAPSFPSLWRLPAPYPLARCWTARS